MKSLKDNIEPENTPHSKNQLYHDYRNIVKFKADLRIIASIKEKEVVLVCGEGCLELPSGAKLDNDKGNLKGRKGNWNGNKQNTQQVAHQ